MAKKVKIKTTEAAAAAADTLPDPLLLKADYGSSLILGRSGTGKSTLIRSMLKANYSRTKKSKTPFVTVNAKDREYSDKKLGLQKKLDYSQIKKAASKSVVIVEDIISMQKKDERYMRHTLNYEAHHKKLKVFAVTHHVYKTSILSMLPFFHYIIFTGTRSNAPLLRNVLNYFKIDPVIRDDWVEKFKKINKTQQTYFFFDCGKYKFYVIDSLSALLGSDSQQPRLLGVANGDDGVDFEGKAETEVKIKVNYLQNRFEKFMVGQSNKHEASAIFSIIVNCIPLHLIREHDLTLSFTSRKRDLRRGPLRVSLVDYITVMLDSKKKINTRILFLHLYLKKSCHIPNIFIKNKLLQL
jgi:hypothetical protein